MWERTICGFRAGGELYLLLIQWLSTNVYRCTRPQATVTNPHTVLSLGSKETHIQSHNPPPGLCFTDQYAFKPTGSTTAAIIALLYTVRQGRINHQVGPTHSTTPGPHWKARRRRDGERDGRGVSIPSQLGVCGALYKLLNSFQGRAPAKNGFGEI